MAQRSQFASVRVARSVRPAILPPLASPGESIASLSPSVHTELRVSVPVIIPPPPTLPLPALPPSARCLPPLPTQQTNTSQVSESTCITSFNERPKSTSEVINSTNVLSSLPVAINAARPALPQRQPVAPSARVLIRRLILNIIRQADADLCLRMAFALLLYVSAFTHLSQALSALRLVQWAPAIRPPLPLRTSLAMHMLANSILDGFGIALLIRGRSSILVAFASTTLFSALIAWARFRPLVTFVQPLLSCIICALSVLIYARFNNIDHNTGVCKHCVAHVGNVIIS